MFIDLDDLEVKELIPGTQVRFVHTEHLTIAYWNFEPDALLPEHHHPQEQICHVIEGEFELTINGNTERLYPGKIAVIPPNALHSGVSITRCRVIDVFHAIREEYR